MDSVEEGKERWQNLIEDFYPPFEESLEEAFKTVERIEIPDEVSDIPCDKCGAMMVYKTGRFGRFLACPNYPECKNTKPIVEKVGVKCPKCGGEIIKRKGKKGRAFTAARIIRSVITYRGICRQANRARAAEG